MIESLMEPVLACVSGTSLGGVSFRHYGLADTALTLTIITFLTGMGLYAARYGYVIRERWRTIIRVVHVVGGVFMTLFMIATYLITPV